MLGEFLKLERILTFDMGGTSTDVSLIEGGRAMITAQAEVGEFPILMPATAVEAMGAGGGSIVWLDGGVMKVGPRSAGSRPGPACYGGRAAKPRPSPTPTSSATCSRQRGCSAASWRSTGRSRNAPSRRSPKRSAST
jgi:N-methylhydantoinase A/oxoprolinase/acetone carboxylase beta subunit